MNLARRAESYLCERLQKQGWQILAQNYRGLGFELDVVAAKEESLVVFEVKARRQDLLPEISELLSESKKKALARGIGQFLTTTSHDSWKQIRVDLVVLLERKQGWQEHIYTGVEINAGI